MKDKSLGNFESLCPNLKQKYLSSQTCCRDVSYHFENGRAWGLQWNWSQVAALLLRVVKNKRQLAVIGNKLTFLVCLTNFYFSRPRGGQQSSETFFIVLALFSHFQNGKLGLCGTSESWDINIWRFKVKSFWNEKVCLQTSIINISGIFFSWWCCRSNPLSTSNSHVFMSCGFL